MTKDLSSLCCADSRKVNVPGWTASADDGWGTNDRRRDDLDLGGQVNLVKTMKVGYMMGDKRQ
jgi:hypothetical protein